MSRNIGLDVSLKVTREFENKALLSLQIVIPNLDSGKDPREVV